MSKFIVKKVYHFSCKTAPESKGWEGVAWVQMKSGQLLYV
jgi:hypothetical protein